MSFSHSEANANTPPGLNQGDVPHACHGHFPLTDFFFVYKLQNMWNDSCQPGCSLSQICRPGCGIFSTQALLLHVPLRGKLCIAHPLFIWSSANGHQFVSSGVSPLNTGREVQVVSADGDVQMKHKQQRRWTLITKTAVPLKKIAICDGFVVAQLKLSHSVKQEILLSLPPLGIMKVF